MSNGLDPTYDAGLLRGDADLLVYTKLVEDNGTPFAIQALPSINYDKMIIPVGVESKTGGNVVFSAECFDLSADCKVVLEDKQFAIFTDLSAGAYNALLDANTVSTDRFRLHVFNSVQSAIGEEIQPGKLVAYQVGNTEIRLIGKVSNAAIATLYDVVGRKVLEKHLEDVTLTVIPTPGVKKGIYLLTLKDNEKTETFKIPFLE
jgi:hypothetical protein